MDIEKELKDVYEDIAQGFSKTRAYRWNKVKEFIDIPKYSLLADIGCGNGKNMIKNSIGVDFTYNFCKICKNKNKEVINASNLNIPFKSNIFDYTISVAVIHHFATEQRRINAIKELIRITKKSGLIFIQVWAYEQPKKSKTKFDIYDKKVIHKSEQDVYVKFHHRYRYYHVFIKNELEYLLIGLNVEIIESFYEFGNWGVIIKKL